MLTHGIYRAYFTKSYLQPFFFDVSFAAPHAPLQAPERFIQQYSAMADQNRREYAGYFINVNYTMLFLFVTIPMVYY